MARQSPHINSDAGNRSAACQPAIQFGGGVCNFIGSSRRFEFPRGIRSAGRQDAPKAPRRLFIRIGNGKRRIRSPAPACLWVGWKNFCPLGSQIPRCVRGRSTVAGLRAWAAERRQNRDTVGAPFGRHKVAGKEVAGNSQKYAKTEVHLPT